MQKKSQPENIAAQYMLYVFFICAAYISVTYVFYLVLAKPQAVGRLFIHESVIHGSAPTPIQYRIFTYYIVEFFHTITGVAIWRLDLILRFIFTSLSMIYLFKYLRHWFGIAESSAGALIIPAILPVTYINYTHQPHDIPNLFFTILALTLIRDRKESWFLLLIPIAMLNRESFIIVFWAWIFYNYDSESIKSLGLKFVLFAVISGAVYLGLINFYGIHKGYVETIQITSNLNPKFLFTWLIRFIAFTGPLLIASFIGFKSKPKFLRRAMGFVIVFLIVNFVFGIAMETRLFLPILPVLIPLTLFTLFPPEKNARIPVSQ